MPAKISEGIRKLLEAPNFANLATLMPDGSPQVTPVWVDFDGTHILVNTAEGRQKPRNVRRDPRVAVSIFNQGSPYSYATIQRPGGGDHPRGRRAAHRPHGEEVPGPRHLPVPPARRAPRHLQDRARARRVDGDGVGAGSGQGPASGGQRFLASLSPLVERSHHQCQPHARRARLPMQATPGAVTARPARYRSRGERAAQATRRSWCSGMRRTSGDKQPRRAG